MPPRSRCLTFLVVAALAVVLVHREAERGTFDAVETTYREWLAGNTVGPPAEPKVTFVRIVPNDESDRAPVLDGWPPVALDFAVLLDNLADYAPPTTVLHEVPPWAPDDPVSGPALVEQAARLPALVAGCLLENQPPLADSREPGDSSDAGGGTEGWSAPLAVAPAQVEGDPSDVPVYTGPLLIPPRLLQDLPGTRLGFTAIDLGTPPPPGRHPLIARSADGSTFVASLVLQALACATGTPLSDVTVTLGQTARIGPFVLPVDRGGRMPVPAWLRADLHRLEADSLFLDAESEPLADRREIESLERLRSDLVILGSDARATRTIDIGAGARVGPAEFAALAITGARTGRLFRELPVNGQRLLWAGLTAVGALLMLAGRRRAFAGTLLLTLFYAIGVLLIFDSLRIWWPVTIPATVLILSAVLSRLLTSEPGTAAKPPPRGTPAGQAGVNS